MIWSSLTTSALQSSDVTEAPSRSTVIASATREISFSLCEIRMQAMPCAFRSANCCASASMTIPSLSSFMPASLAPSLRNLFIAPW